MSADLIAVVDVETTGLYPWRHDRIIEIAVVLMLPNGQTKREYETLLNPNRDIGPTHIHGISAADVLHAPSFSDIAGDLIEVLSSARTIAGHNITFDINFLTKEYERIGISFPDVPMFCTYQMFGRNLVACCDEFRIIYDGMPHHALTDARMTAQLIALLCAEDNEILDHYRINKNYWPRFTPKRTACLTREQSRKIINEPSGFIKRLKDKIHHDVDADEPNVIAYLALIDRVLEDRTIDLAEENALVDAALHWKLTTYQIDEAHKRYLQNLAILALEDGVISHSERNDIHLVARLLGQDESALDSVLESAATLLSKVRTNTTHQTSMRALEGKSVCFTGELQAKISGQHITREMAEIIAKDAGLTIASNVTKKRFLAKKYG